MLIIRPAQSADLPAVQAIYAHHVLHGTGTFEVDPPSVDDMHQRWQDVCSKNLPWLVACVDDRVLGYAYANWFKPRPAYRFSAEDSIYLTPQACGQGWGRLLLSELSVQAERAGVRKLIAVIGDSANTASIATHRNQGFNHVGTIAACGWKMGRWLDVVLYEKSIGMGAQCPPDMRK